jgi:RNA polymerase sigma-70 factor (sigma-E family)
VDSTAEREFTEFVIHRSQELLRVAYALVGEQHAAQDLLQSALAKTAARWSHIQATPEIYVRRVLYHEFVSSWRRAWRRRERPVAVLPDRAGESDPAGAVDTRLTLRDALQILPARQRAVLVLRYFEDLSERQVAEVLGCSTGTVASQASRALARLRAAMTAGAVQTRSLTTPADRRK